MTIIRYLVKDVDQAIAFYVNLLDFKLDQQMGSAFAKVVKDDLELWLSGPQSSAAHTLTNGDKPQSGGWNRFVIKVKNLQDLVEKLKEKPVLFRSEIVTGPGGKQILLEDPSGNPIELFEPSSNS